MSEDTKHEIRQCQILWLYIYSQVGSGSSGIMIPLCALWWLLVSLWLFWVSLWLFCVSLWPLWVSLWSFASSCIPLYLNLEPFGPSVGPFNRNTSTAVGWIVMKCGSDIHVPLRMNCKNFVIPWSHLAPSSGQHVNVSNTLVYDQTPAELQTFPSAPAGLFSMLKTG